MTVADISSELAAISNAQYGSDVRQAMYDGLSKVNMIDTGTINLTPSSGITIGTDGYLIGRKIGSLVIITGFNINVAASAYNSSGHATLCNASSMAPSRLLRFPITIPIITNYVVSILVSTPGNVILSHAGSAAVNSLCFTCVYFTD